MLNNVSDIESNNPHKYSLSISIALLLISSAVGSISNGVILLTFLTSKSLRKARYAPFVSFHVANLLHCIVWMPLEIAQIFHEILYDFLSYGLKIANHSCLILFLTAIAGNLFAISLKDLLIASSKKCRRLKERFVRISLPVSWLFGILTAAIFLVLSLDGNSPDVARPYHLLLNDSANKVELCVLTIDFVALASLLIAVAIFLVVEWRTVTANVDSSPDPTPLNDSGLFNRSTAVENRDKAAEENRPTSQLLPAEVPPKSPVKDVDSILGVNLLATHQGGKRKNSLTINFGNLNRRRHTICQIGDTMPPVTHIERANQYGYVRKFSVDVMALQAQLENPKSLGKEQAFLSQQQISSLQDSADDPLRRSKTSLLSIKEDDSALSPKDPRSAEVHAELDNRCGGSGGDEETGSDGITCQSRLVRSYMKFSSLMVVIFLSTVLPLYVAVTLRGGIDAASASYLDAITLTLAISSLQAVLYPYLVYRMDACVKKSTRQIMRRAWLRVTGRVKIDGSETCEN